MEEEKIPYEKQIFICTNDRLGEKPSCGDHQGVAVFKELRRIAKERGLHPRIRVAQAKCLGKCSMGVNVMVYSRRCDSESQVGTPTSKDKVKASEPDQIWHHGVTLGHVNELAEKYLS